VGARHSRIGYTLCIDLLEGFLLGNSILNTNIEKEI